MPDIRVTFTKLDKLKYISHLDLQRAIHRMLVRSGLPIAYSEGFNPHPRLNIALPLSIYQEGERELFDFRVVNEVALDEIESRLKASVFPGMDVVKVELAVGKLATKHAIWRLETVTDIPLDEFKSAFESAMPVLKRSKAGEKTVDIQPMTELVSAESTENGIIARVKLNAAGNDYLNPSYVAAFFGERLKLVRTVRENIIF
ncbi:MAG: TIGR03936 family radical SAM-associated protein [Clostridia bacterium]|nr:TIGR03936 family radical SAM-associated protein [Clostridia bacterium]